MRYLAHLGTMQFHHTAIWIPLRAQNPVVAAADSDNFPAQSPRCVYSPVNDGIQARGVPAAGVDRNLLNLFWHPVSLHSSSASRPFRLFGREPDHRPFGE